MPFFAWIGAAIARVFSTRLGGWVASALGFLGLQLAVDSFVIAPIMAQLQATAAGLPADAIGWMRFFNVDRYISCILSAMAIARIKRAFLRRVLG